MENKNEETTGEVLRLPLWKSCVERMIADGVEYGQTYSAEYFEEKLKVGRDTMQFSLALSSIRRRLESHGFYLSGRGQQGNQFVILAPNENRDILASYQAVASDALKRGVILGTNTRLDSLSAEDRRKHEGALERIALRYVLMQRSGKVRKIVEKHKPKALQSGS